MGRLMGVDLASEYIHTIVLTGRVEDGGPVSTLLIANPENGKTSIVLEKSGDYCINLTDVSGKGLKFLCQIYPDASHFIISDMGTVMAHSQKTREYFFGMLLALTEEGIKTIAGPDGIESIKSGRKAIIGCITSDQAKDNRMWWYRRGLARRLIPFHYAYSEALVIRIKDVIMRGQHKNFEEGVDSSKFPKLKLKVALSPEMAQEIRKISDRRAAVLGQLGISLLIRYQTLAKAHAIYRGDWKKSQVTAEDIDFLMRIDPFIDWATPGLFL